MTGFQKRIPARGDYGPWNFNVAHFCCTEFHDKAGGFLFFVFLAAFDRQFNKRTDPLKFAEQPEDHWYAEACILTPPTQPLPSFLVLSPDEWLKQVLGGQSIRMKVGPGEENPENDSI